MNDLRPVGIFDSGIGGLTVLAELRRRFPEEHFLYLGDTARLPYGTKSPDTVVRYALGAARALVGRRIKLLVVACNTASALALGALREAVPVPVLGVVEPGARAAAAATRGRIGVIGTESTIASSAYVRAVQALLPDARVFTRACPLFVPLAEEGWFDHPVTRQVAEAYLADLAQAGIDTLILGCTHYPLLRRAIAAAVGPGVTLVDSATAVADEIEAQGTATCRRSGRQGGVQLLVTDAAARFARIATSILGAPLPAPLELIDL